MCTISSLFFKVSTAMIPGKVIHLLFKEYLVSALYKPAQWLAEPFDRLKIPSHLCILCWRICAVPGILSSFSKTPYLCQQQLTHEMQN